MFKNKLSQFSLHWYEFGNISDQNFVIWVIQIQIFINYREKEKKKKNIVHVHT